MGIILPQEVDQSTLPGYGGLYAIGKLYGILTLLLEKSDTNIKQVVRTVITINLNSLIQTLVV